MDPEATSDRSMKGQLAYTAGAAVAGLGGGGIAYTGALHLVHNVAANDLGMIENATGFGMMIAGFLGFKLSVAFNSATSEKNGPYSSVRRNFTTWDNWDKAVGALVLGATAWMGVQLNDAPANAKENRTEESRIARLPFLDARQMIEVPARAAHCSNADMRDKRVISVRHKEAGAAQTSEHQLKCG